MREIQQLSESEYNSALFALGSNVISTYNNEQVWDG
jgi:hypothetical protein